MVDGLSGDLALAVDDEHAIQRKLLEGGGPGPCVPCPGPVVGLCREDLGIQHQGPEVQRHESRTRGLHQSSQGVGGGVAQRLIRTLEGQRPDMGQVVRLQCLAPIRVIHVHHEGGGAVHGQPRRRQATEGLLRRVQGPCHRGEHPLRSHHGGVWLHISERPVSYHHGALGRQNRFAHGALSAVWIVSTWSSEATAL